MVTDPISDLIIRLKNASDVKKPVVSVYQSKLAENLAEALKKTGYISSIEKNKKTNQLELGIVYFEGTPRINGVQRISSSSRRIYLKANDIRVFRSGFGNTFLSTPKGILVDMDAKKLKVGGEVLFKIW
ncbi:MAG: 30S ribosomal protein S8 [bacterium]|nr:30S ribosomal protein S8 [bacterium]